MTSTPYKRKFLADGDTPDDDSGWDDQDEELARGFPLEPDIAAAPGSMGPDGLPWYAYRGQVADSPMPDQGSYATVDEPSEPEGAKGVSPSGGAPITDAIMNGDTTPEAGGKVAEPVQPPTDGKPSFWERYRQGVEHTPVLTKAPWWRDLAARGMGAAAGWVNAAGHLRNPINAGAAEEEIRHPGFSQQQEVWESQMAPIRAGLSAEMGQREAQLKAQDTAAQAALRYGQADLAHQRGHFYQTSADGRWGIDDKAHIMFNWRTGESKPLPDDPVQRYQAVLAATHDEVLAKEAGWPSYKAPPAARPVSPMDQARDILLHPDKHSPEEVQRAQALVHPPKQFAPPRGGSAGPRPPSGATFSAIEGQRTAAYTAAQARYERAMTAAGANPQARAQAQANLQAEKRLADEGYARRVAAATGGAAPPPPANRPPLSQIFGR